MRRCENWFECKPDEGSFCWMRHFRGNVVGGRCFGMELIDDDDFVLELEECSLDFVLGLP
jgi:hypothetical protein